MPNIRDACGQLDIYTEKVSTQTRTLAIGLLPFAGGLILNVVIGSKDSAKLPAWILSRLFIVGVGALLALGLDLAQYGFMFLYMRSFQKRLEKKIDEALKKDATFDKLKLDESYNESHPFYAAGRVCFATKVLVLLFAVAWLTFDTYIVLN
jgi:hypothetical protein